MDALSYVLASPWTDVAVFLVGWTGGLVSAGMLALVVKP